MLKPYHSLKQSPKFMLGTIMASFLEFATAEVERIQFNLK